MEQELLVMKNINKSFPGVRALRDVSLSLRRGEVHALIGENGAGKSTLMKVLSGVHQADSGEILWEGKPVQIHSTTEATAMGISIIYQELNLMPNMSIRENIFLGRENRRARFFVDFQKTSELAKTYTDMVGLTADVNTLVKDLSIAQRQMVEVAKALSTNAKLIVMDEPTSSLTDRETEILMNVIRNLRDQGVTVVFISHRLSELFEISDRITVLRDGKLVGEYKIAELPRVQLVSKMLGKELDDLSEIKTEGAEDALENAEVVYEASGLSSAAGVRPFDFSIRKGEVNGFTGLLGSGRSESVRAIFGADHVSSGTVKMGGKLVKITSPLAAMKHGISYLPEDRKRDGIIGDLSVRDNIILARQVLDGFFHPISKAKAEKYAEEYIRLLSIKTASTDTPIKSLSGGNQQKVILARWLLANPVYMILDEPTRGIDVGTKVEIQKLVLQLAAEGKSVTFISSEIDEMLRVCSRLVVMRDRQVVGELRGSDLNQSSIMKTIAGGEQA